MSEWLDVMLEEIARKQREADEAIPTTDVIQFATRRELREHLADDVLERDPHGSHGQAHGTSTEADDDGQEQTVPDGLGEAVGDGQALIAPHTPDGGDGHPLIPSGHADRA